MQYNYNKNCLISIRWKWAKIIALLIFKEYFFLYKLQDDVVTNDLLPPSLNYSRLRFMHSY